MTAKIDQLFKQFNNQTPGCALCVVKKGKTILEKSYGLADIKAKTLITPNTAFRLASLTKPFTAMAIMLLAEEGLLHYEDRLNKFFPDFSSFGKEITIRQLLTHTSGMPDHEKPLYQKIRPGDEPTIYDSRKVLKSFKKPLFRPGSTYQYSDAGFVVLALLIEKVSDQKYGKFLKDTIFIPLKMDNTIVVDETKPLVKNRAYGYKKTTNGYEFFDYDPLNYVVGDEGIYSTVKDLAAWRTAWNSEKLVNQRTLVEALTPAKKNGIISRCGFSWFIDKNFIFHDGYWVGFTNIMLTEMTQEITVILLTNTTEFDSESKRRKIAMQVLNTIDL